MSGNETPAAEKRRENQPIGGGSSGSSLRAVHWSPAMWQRPFAATPASEPQEICRASTSPVMPQPQWQLHSPGGQELQVFDRDECSCDSRDAAQQAGCESSALRAPQQLDSQLVDALAAVFAEFITGADSRAADNGTIRQIPRTVVINQTIGALQGASQEANSAESAHDAICAVPGESQAGLPAEVASLASRRRRASHDFSDRSPHVLECPGCFPSAMIQPVD